MLKEQQRNVAAQEVIYKCVVMGRWRPQRAIDGDIVTIKLNYYEQNYIFYTILCKTKQDE